MSLIDEKELPVDLKNLPPPNCQHGPTLLFKEMSMKFQDQFADQKSNTTGNYYYACSATRDPKFCPFQISVHKWKRIFKSKTESFDSLGETNKSSFKFLLNLKNSICGFCLDCCRVLVASTTSQVIPKEHLEKNHQGKCRNILDRNEFFKSLSKPSRNLMKPETKNQNMAQYYFSLETIRFIKEFVLSKFQYDSLICIGCPTIHEELLETNQRSILLDLDSRYQQFYSEDQFIRFNMFNGYFFQNSGLECLKKFTESSEKILFLIDPPFGGLISCLAKTLTKIHQQLSSPKECSIILFFPYFNEHWIRKAEFPVEIKITDFIVTYENHRKYGRKKESHNDSPVRIFTDLDLGNFVEFNTETYRWCPICKRTVFKNNQHCKQCAECPARDSSKSIRHCLLCERCVKITSKHCHKCQICHLPKKCE